MKVVEDALHDLEGTDRIERSACRALPPWRPILVVLPLILLESRTWEEEIGSRFKGALSIHCSSSTERRSGIAAMKRRNTSPSTKISHALKTIHPDIHIACTGTPVENRLLDLWNLIDTVQPALLGTSKDFSAKYKRTYAESAEPVVDPKRNLLFGRCNSLVLRRNKADALGLPPKTYEPLYAPMTDWEVQTHQELLASVRGAGSAIKILHKLRCTLSAFLFIVSECGSMTALIEAGERCGALECIEEVAPDYYRCRCLRCRYDGVLCNVSALLTGRAKTCYDCNALAKATPHQRVVMAFRRRLDLSPEREEIDRAA